MSQKAVDAPKGRRRSPSRRKEGTVVYMDKAEEQVMLLMVPVRTYGTLDQLDQAAHRVIQTIAVNTHQEVGGITPDGRKITYNSNGTPHSFERLDGTRVVYVDGKPQSYDQDGNLVLDE